jgi:hypothetical protein
MESKREPAMPRFQCGPLLRIRTPHPTCPTEPTCRDDIGVRLPLTEEECIRSTGARIRISRERLQRLTRHNPARRGGSARCGICLERPAKYTLACRTEAALAPVAQLCPDPTVEWRC